MTDTAASVPTLMSILEARQAVLEQAQKKVEEAQTLVADSERQIVRAVRVGRGSTGDPFRDKFILAFSISKRLDKLEALYRELEGRLASRQGELVMLIYTCSKTLRVGGTGGDTYQSATMCRVGVLDSESLVLLGEGIAEHLTLPVSRYLEWEHQIFLSLDAKKIELYKENIFEDRHQETDPPDLRQHMLTKAGMWEPRPIFHSTYKEPSNLRIVVGTKEVKEWLDQEHAEPEVYTILCHALSILELQPTSG